MNARIRGRRRFLLKSAQIKLGDGDINFSNDNEVIDDFNRNRNRNRNQNTSILPSAFLPFMDPFTIQCQVCLNEVPVLNTVRCPGDGHAICRDDVQTLFDRVVDGSDSWPPRCCSTPLSITTCAAFLKEETIDKVQELLKVRAESAGKEDARNDKADQLFVQESIQKGELQICPDCGTRIYRTGGCSHMTCEMCQTEFCYNCGCIWNRCICPKPPDVPEVPDQQDQLGEPRQPFHIDLRPRRRIIRANPPQDSAWAILNSNIGVQYGFSRDPETCSHEPEYQDRLPRGRINTNCCALDTERLQCRLCGYQHCRGCKFQPRLQDIADIEVRMVATTD